jgi:hypothetical protein
MVRALRFGIAFLMAGAALQPSPALAQGLDLLLPSETDFAANRGLIRLLDLDANGDFDGCGEFAVDFMGLQGGPCAISQTGNSCPNIRDVAFASIAGVPTIFWVRTDTDVVERGVDLNGNGRIETGEQNLFFSFPASAGPGSYFPGFCDADSSGALWVCTNASTNTANQGIWRFRDLNGDGAASPGVTVVGEPEVSHYLAGAFTVPDAAGTGTVMVPSAANFRALVVDPADRVIAFDADTGVYFAFKDLGPTPNYVWDAGESTNFWNPNSPCIGGLKSNPDAGVTYPPVFSWGTSAPCSPGAFGNALRMVAVSVSSTGQPLYWFGSTSGTAFANWVGLVFRGVDTSVPANGDVNDAGEVTLWYNGSTAPGFPGPTPLFDPPSPSGAQFSVSIIENLGAAGDSAYMFNNSGPTAIDNREHLGFGAEMDTIWRLTDGNGDGDADDLFEQVRVATLPPGEFWGPKGKMISIPSGALPAPAATRISAPGCAPPLSPAPDNLMRAQIGTIGNPSVGSASFAITLKESPTSGGGQIPSGGLPILVLGVGAGNLDLSLIFPASLGCTLVPTLDVLVTTLALVPAGNFTWTSGGTTNVVGVSEATAPVPVPAAPALIGGCVRAQWAVVGLDLAFLFSPFVSTELDARLGP